MNLKPLSPVTANLIYDILVKICGAAESERQGFVYDQTGNNPTDEWRFRGLLDFGGKFWRNCGKIYVTCYKEDETPARLEIIEKANEALKKIG